MAERERCSVVCVPLGCVEWRPLHLPIGTDGLKSGEVARQVAGRVGVAWRAKEAIDKRAETTLDACDADSGVPTAKHVFQAARDGDPLAQGIVEETVDYLAQAVASVACTLNPEIMILGGALMRSHDLVLERIRDRVRRVVPFPPKIVLSQLGEGVILYGAIALAIRSTREDISVHRVSAPVGLSRGEQAPRSPRAR